MPWAAQQRADACDKLFGCKWLDQIVVGARVKPFHAILDAVARGQDQHGQSTARAPNGFDEAQTVAIWQPKIQNDGVIWHRFDMPNRVVKANSFVDAEATILKGCAHVAPQAVVVLDNKNPHAELLVSSPKTALKERV